MNRRSFQLGFSGGVMSPGMFGLVSDAEFRRGAAEIRNAFVLPQGGLRRRPGTRISNAVKNSAKKVRLERFRFSDDQAYCVEIGDLYIRLHAGGAPVLAAPRVYTVSQTVTFNAGTEEVTWTGEHELSEDVEVRFTTTGTLPTATGGDITAGVSYYAQLTAAGNICKLRRTPGGSTIDITSVGAGTHTGHAYYTIGDTVKREGRIASVDTGTETILSSNVHGFSAGDRVHFVADPGATLPGGLDANTDYFVIGGGLTAAEFRVSLTSGGVAVNLTSGGTGVTKWHYGTRASQHNYYCIGAHVQQPPPNFIYWYGMPTTGELEIPTSFLEADLFQLTTTQSNDVMTFAHRSYFSAELRRYSATKWAFIAVTFAATIDAPTGLAVVANTGVSLNIDAITTVGTTLKFSTGTDRPHGLAAGLSTVQLIDGTAGAHTYLTSLGKFRVATVVDPFSFYLAKLVGGGLVTTADASGAYTQNTIAFVSVDPVADTSTRYVITAVSPDGLESVASSPVSATNNLDAQGATNTLTWSAATGARRYYIYREESGLFGFVGQVDADNTLQFVDDGSIAPDLSRTVPSLDSGLSGTEHPGAVGYFQGRRFFAATENHPQTAWGTRSGTESDLSYHIPLVDSDRLQFTVAIREYAEIRHIVPTQHLLFLTVGGELRITPRNSDVLTPAGVDVRPQSYVGASYVAPLVQGAWVVFAAERGGRIWATAYDYAGDTFVPVDLSVRAAELFDAQVPVDSALVRAPNPTLLFTSTDGAVRACTFLPEQNVRGWSLLDTAGTIESVTSVPEGDEDRIYLAVLRDGTRYVERMEPQADADRADGLFLDAAVTVTSGSTVTVPHPNGSSLDALVDGVAYRGLIVAGGQVTLPVPAVAVAHVGRRYTTTVQTLPLALQMEAYAQGRQMNVNRATLRLRQSGPAKVGPAATALSPLFADAGTLVSDFRSQLVPAQWANSGQLYIQADDPLPFEVTSMTLEVSVGGE